MMVLVTGGSKCGKSSYAESLLEKFNGTKIYIATMQPFGEDARAAIERHRKMRAEKHFTTVEKYTDLHELDIPSGCAVLLECMGNLTANEMFGEIYNPSPADKIMKGLRHIRESADMFVIVSNSVGCDGNSYTKETQKYIEVMAQINSEITAEADRAVECVFGIPLVIKENV